MDKIMDYALNGILITIALVLVFTLLRGIVMVPQTWEYLITRFGKKHRKLTAGLHWIFPFFGIYKVEHKVYMGTLTMALSLGRDANFGGGIVDFKDESAPVESYFYFRIVESEKAAYDVSDILKLIEQHGDGALRSYLANFTIEEANSLKNFFNVEKIAHSVIDKDLVADKDHKTPSLKRSKLYRALRRRGVETEGFIVTDIDLPERVIAQRRRELEADMDRQVSLIEVDKAKNVAKSSLIKAEADKRVKIKSAEGEAASMNNISASMAKRIQELVKNGMTPQEAAAHVVLVAKTEALSKAEKVTWLEGSTNASLGAEIGAGMSTQK